MNLPRWFSHRVRITPRHSKSSPPLRNRCAGLPVTAVYQRDGRRVAIVLYAILGQRPKRTDHSPYFILREFGISKSLACKIFNSWIPLLALKLKDLIVWLPKETLRACCPESFLENFARTTCIIDCAETFIQRSTNLRSRGETYSNDKSHNTAKYLVAISPHGQIMFISKAFGGRASDKVIVENSGLLNYLISGDEVMADRGFTIEKLLFSRQIKLNIPAFTKGKDQLTGEEVTATRRIARVRIHVERAARRLKVFKILSTTVPVSCLNLFDDILIVCSALVNLRGDLIRDVQDSD
ncbi:uncharacterized protein LOC121387372 [Gigantopelta aegis]|uniref:uncharacterized protein LOC121387372 n=1 Tax=Gigantopelta aegis TaxID=1735272 RepID=UPI001B88D21D|nr:uncharacterized protein LOC121387372 [Gigantopelta aegis]